MSRPLHGQRPRQLSSRNGVWVLWRERGLALRFKSKQPSNWRTRQDQKKWQASSEAESLQRKRAANRDRLPDHVNGTISSDWHIATDPAAQVFTLEEFGEIEFVVSYEEFELNDLESGGEFQFSIEYCEGIEEFGISGPCYRVHSIARP